MHRLVITALLLALGILTGCRGSISENEPIHLNRNMDEQARFDPQEANPFFADGRSMRPPVVGTVARGALKDDPAFYFGRTASGETIETMPVPLTRELLLRGQERYDIFCSVCHGQAGDGQGIIMTGGYGYAPVPTYHSDYLRGVSDGHLFDVISNGIRNMPGYAPQIPVADRWAITAYVRALQRSQNAAEGDLPAGILSDLEQGRGNAGAPASAPADTTQGGR